MAFQFQCPRGHLLEAEIPQVGQQCQCPMCGELFAIPSPMTASPPTGAAPFPPSPAPADHFAFSPGGAPNHFQNSPNERLLHIPCPRGHELEVPTEMLGQDVLCPHCQTQFRLRDKDSVEYKRKKQQEQELKDYKRGQLWMTWAVVIAVIVVLGLAIMIGISATQ